MSSEFMIGAHFEGRYRIDAEIGSGGVGAVYRAVHLKLGRPVALKVLQEKYGASKELRHRFEREAMALAALSHPNIVTVTDYGIAGGVPYLVMELLEGNTLEKRLQSGRLEPTEAFDVARQILRALSFVHEEGLVHRDMKPGNIFLQDVPGSKPHVKILDFGLAKFLATEQQETALTRAGQVFGTPSYMAPEQVAGQETDARTDVYAVGVILFEMLTGRKPYEGNASEVMRKHLVEQLPALSDVAPELNATPELEALLRRATAKLQGDRFPNAQALSEALEQLPSPAVTHDPAGARARAEAKTVAAFSGGTPNPLAGPAPETRPSLSAPRRSGRGLSTALYAVLPLAAILGLAALMHTLQERSAAAPPGKHANGADSSGHVEGPLPSAAPPLVDHRPATAPASSALPPEEQPAAAAEPPAEPAPATEEPAESPDSVKPPPDPARLWKTAPKILIGTRDAVRAGTPLSRRTINYLHEYNAKNQGDPRGHLLLARAYMNRGWRKDALNEYALAYKLNPEVRGEPKMLSDLVDMVAHGSTAAADLVRNAYGKHALGEVETAMDRASANPAIVKRLEKLRDNLKG